MKMNLKNRNCAGLMVSLFLLLLLVPLVQFGTFGRILLSLLLSMTLLGGVSAVGGEKKHAVLAFALMIPPIVVEWLGRAFEWEVHNLLLTPSLYHCPVYGYVMYLILRYVFKPGQLKLDHLYGAISVYLLLGLFFTHLYISLELFRPGSFTLDPSVTGNAVGLFSSLYYFSFVTLTSLGYGDICPVSVEARSLAVLEAIMGVLVIGSLVARVAGAAGLNSPASED